MHADADPDFADFAYCTVLYCTARVVSSAFAAVLHCLRSSTSLEFGIRELFVPGAVCPSAVDSGRGAAARFWSYGGRRVLPTSELPALALGTGDRSARAVAMAKVAYDTALTITNARESINADGRAREARRVMTQLVGRSVGWHLRDAMQPHTAPKQLFSVSGRTACSMPASGRGIPPRFVVGCWWFSVLVHCNYSVTATVSQFLRHCVAVAATDELISWRSFVVLRPLVLRY